MARENYSVTLKRKQVRDLPQQWTSFPNPDAFVRVYAYETEKDWTKPGAYCHLVDRESTSLYFEEGR